MNRHSWLYRLRPVALVAAATVAACQQDRLSEPPMDAVSSLRVGLEASSLTAGPGQQVAVAIRADTRGAPIAGLQGTLRFDPARLTYLGQSAGPELTVVNSSRADQGELRVASLDVDGLPIRTAVLVFEVRGIHWSSSLRYETEVAGDRHAEAVAAERARALTLATDLTVPAEFGRYTVEQSVRRLWPEVAVTLDRPARTPGEYRLNLVYGDARLDGNVNILDAADVANTAVGNNAIIVGTDAPSRDRVVAANVRPANLPGLGEGSDLNPPGRNANGSRSIDILDAVAVANEAVGNAQDIVGEVIPGRGPLASARELLTGTITGTRTLSRDTIYEIRGIVKVGDEAGLAGELVIQAGTRIEGQSDSTTNATTGTGGTAALFITRNGRIIADGTALQPILMTCTNAVKTKGCWGGLWIAGNAPINNLTGSLALASPVIPGRAATGGCYQNVGEGGATQYGGCIADDSSGVLRYVVEEYSGKVVSGNNELNGITMGGVGSKTVVEYIQVTGGLDDGLELFGGTVNVRGLYSIGNSDDSFDYCCGWNGNAQFVIMQHDSTDADKGFEVDNTEASATYESSPFTTGTVYNVTFAGRAEPLGGTGSNASNDAFHLRRGTSTTIRNALVVGARVNLDIDDAATCTDAGGSGIVSIQNSLFAGYGALGNSDGSDPVCATPGGSASTEADFLTLSGNQTVASYAGILISPFSRTLPDFRPSNTLPAGVSLVGATPPNNGFFDVSATYIGAVPQANATGTNIPWYAGWTRPF